MKKCIMIIAPQVLPIPDVRGGATEMLITNLLKENEKQHQVDFVVVSKYDKEAEKHKYLNSKFYYFDGDNLVNDKIKLLSFKFFILRVSTKIKRIAKKIGLVVKNWNDDIVYLDLFHFQCFQIAKKEKVDILINCGSGIVDEYKIFYKFPGKENIYYYLHWVQEENVKFRQIINNSISISSFVKNEWVKDKQIYGKNLVLYSGIDIQRFSFETNYTEKQKLRKSIGVGEKDTLIIYCGRLVREKGISELLKAFDLLNDNKNFKLLVIGSVAFANNASTDFSNAIVSKMKSIKSVTYLGYIPNDVLPKYYNISDIMVIPTTCQEGAGLVAIEGMASGLPLIVTDSGGMVEYVNNDCAIKIPIDDELPVNLKNEILRLAEDKEKMKKMGEAGKARSRLFSKENYYNNFVSLFDN